MAKFQKEMSKSSFASIEHLSLFFEKIKDRPEEHQQQLNIIKERVENNFRELSAVSEQRENSMDSTLKKLKEGAQLFVNLNMKANELNRSIFSKDKKKYKVLIEG